MAPEDLYRIVWTEDAQISPDGGRIAFVRKQMDAARDEYLAQIWVTAFEDAQPRRLTSGPRSDSHPRWSPDGAWLAFLSNRPSPSGESTRTGRPPDETTRESNLNQIWLLPASGGEARALTVQREGVSSFAWSPDSRTIAFVARASAATAVAEQDRLPTRFISTLRYKSNGDGFIYDRRAHIFAQPIDGEALQLTDGDHDDGEPCWSPDGSTIAFASTGHQTSSFGMVTDVFEVNASGGEARRLTSGSGTAHVPSYSPDGRQIAYYGHEDPQPGGSRNLVLWVMQADGQAPRPLTLSLDRTAIADVPPIWDSDGDAILIGILDSGAAALYSIDCGERGESPVPIVSGRRLLSSWSSAADGTRIAFTASTPTEPPEAFTRTYDRWAHRPGGSASTSFERKVSSFNSDWLADVQLAAPQEFRFKAADGLEIEGWVMPTSVDAMAVDARAVDTRTVVATARDAESATKERSDHAPVLLNVHGGPHAFYGWGFFDEFQVQAGAGYAVVYINPRGSQGYGESFATACCGDWGGADYEDLMRGLDEALRRFPFLNGSRLGVLGGSYGGFMTSWIVGHTDRFLAAISERAVNAPVSLFGTSDIGYWFEQYEVGGDPFINRDSYLRHSPLTYAQKISTPLLIMHSENDLRCPIEQSEQLYVALRLLGNTDTVFVRFPEENHELTRSGKPSRRVERFQILLDWFDHYLQNDGRVEAAGVRSAGLRAAMSAAKHERSQAEATR